VYELVQASIAATAAYLAWQLIRRRTGGRTRFGLLLLGVAALCGIGLLGREVESTGLGGLGAIGVGAGICMLIVAPVIRDLANRLAHRERYRLADQLLTIAEVLAPGSGVRDERALLGAMRELREGRIDQTVEALTAAKRTAPAEARRAIDERIAMLYLSAYRWDEGLAHAEQFLLGELADRPSPPRSDARGPRADVPGRELALGVAPAVWIELLGAYARTGDLDRAAGMLARLEDACDRRDDTSAALWLHRARLMFLALAGRVAAVEALTGPRAARHLTASARAYWRAVALERGGDGAAASAAYARARRGARGMPRTLIDEALVRLAAQPTGGPGTAVVLGDAASQVVARVEAAPLPVIVPARSTRPVATWTLTALVCAAAAAVTLGFGPTADFGVMFRAGAMIRSQVQAGEWWRLIACVVLHAGVLHLAVNAVSLWVLGRLCEQLYGTARTVAIFALAGVAGAVASFAINPGPSLGASGAIFGLLGAALVELALHRDRHIQPWPTWMTLGVLAIAQLGYGFFVPQVDQYAHGGGLIAGAIAGAVLSPSVRWHRAGAWLARAIAACAVVATAAAAVMVARTSAADSLAAAPAKEVVVNGVTVDAPSGWIINDGELYDGAVFVVLAFDRKPATAGIAPTLAAAVSKAPDDIRARNFEDVTTPDEPLVALPDGWTGKELEASVENDLGDRTAYRVVVAAKQFGGTIAIAQLYAPASLVRLAPRFFTALLASAR
jgi:membrane associated rhomboid family serine protease